MVRPRRPFSGQEVIVERGADWYEDQGWSDAPGTRRSVRWKSQRLADYRTPNGIKDPLTFMLVVDALLRIDHQIELRALALAEWMTIHYKQMQFDSKTVGRVLLDLYESLDGAGNSFLYESRDWKGRFYLISPTEDNVKGLWKLRDDLNKLFEAHKEAREAGNPEKLIDTPLLECPSLRGEYVEPA